MFQNIDKIKNLQNTRGKKIYIRQFTTQRQIEQRKKSQQVADMMAQEDQVDQAEVSIEGDKIYIGEHQYHKKVQPPDPTHVLRLPLGKLNEIMATQVDRTDAITVDDNVFTPYSMCTTDYKQIENAYMKLRLNHAEAKHIVCAWNIPGPKPFESIDNCDDGDHGMGYMIQKLMMTNSITHRVIFIVRNVGYKLNDKRAETYIKAAKAAIMKHPMNHLINKTQTVTEEVEEKESTYARAVQNRLPEQPKGKVIRRNPNKRNKDPHATRGRDRGRGGNMNTRPKNTRDKVTPEIYYPQPRDASPALDRHGGYTE